jgi:uncharacterized protein YcbX
LLIGESSLNDLNSRLEQPLPMNRFRPSIVISGTEPYEEDEMAHFTINEIDFFGVKPCARCVITTIDQQTAVKGKEPLRTLSTYRQKNNKIYFGQNLVHKGSGNIAIGDEVIILSRTSFQSLIKFWDESVFLLKFYGRIICIVFVTYYF